QSINLNCPCPVSTTTSTTVTTSTTSSTTTSTTVPGTTTTTTIGGTTTTSIGGTTTTRICGTTTTSIGGTTTTSIGGTTTTSIGGTTTTSIGGTTTTTVGGSTECPSSANLTIAAGTGITCTNNADCAVGTCNLTLGRCVTVTELDSGWTGIAHDADLTDNVVVKANLDCGGTGPACGQCDIAGVDPEPRNCRCSNDNTIICNQPFAVNATDCGVGNICNCYVGPPLSLSAGNTPACI